MSLNPTGLLHLSAFSTILDFLILKTFFYLGFYDITYSQFSSFLSGLFFLSLLCRFFLFCSSLDVEISQDPIWVLFSPQVISSLPTVYCFFSDNSEIYICNPDFSSELWTHVAIYMSQKHPNLNIQNQPQDCASSPVLHQIWSFSILCPSHCTSQ